MIELANCEVLKDSVQGKACALRHRLPGMLNFHDVAVRQHREKFTNPKRQRGTESIDPSLTHQVGSGSSFLRSSLLLEFRLARKAITGST